MDASSSKKSLAEFKKNSDVPVGGRVVDAAELFGAEAAIWIQHEKILYRLMKTRQGKLILTK